MFDLRHTAVPLVEGLEHQAVVRLVLDDLVRPAADRLRLIDVRVGAGGEDAEGEVVEDAGIWRLQPEDDGVVVGGLDMVDGGVARLLRRHEVGRHQRVVRPLHVAGLHRLSGVEPRGRVEVKDDGPVVRRLPLCGHVGGVVEVRSDLHQSAVVELRGTAGVLVVADAPVEVRRRCLEGDHQRVLPASRPVLFTAAGNEQRNRDDSEHSPSIHATHSPQPSPLPSEGEQLRSARECTRMMPPRRERDRRPVSPPGTESVPRLRATHPRGSHRAARAATRK